MIFSLNYLCNQRRSCAAKQPFPFRMCCLQNVTASQTILPNSDLQLLLTKDELCLLWTVLIASSSIMLAAGFSGL